MILKNLVEKLVTRYGNRVKVNSEYHVQVISDKGPHDIWINRYDELKIKPAGCSKVLNNVSLDRIFKEVDHVGKTDVEKMRAMLELAQFMNSCEKDARIYGDGIYTDAGFKDGVSRLAMIMINGESIDAKVRTIKISSSFNAEVAVIKLAIDWDPYLTIYNDNKSAIQIPDKIAKDSQNEGKETCGRKSH